MIVSTTYTTLTHGALGKARTTKTKQNSASHTWGLSSSSELENLCFSLPLLHNPVRKLDIFLIRCMPYQMYFSMRCMLISTHQATPVSLGSAMIRRPYFLNRYWPHEVLASEEAHFRKKEKMWNSVKTIGIHQHSNEEALNKHPAKDITMHS